MADILFSLNSDPYIKITGCLTFVPKDIAYLWNGILSLPPLLQSATDWFIPIYFRGG